MPWKLLLFSLLCLSLSIGCGRTELSPAAPAIALSPTPTTAATASATEERPTLTLTPLPTSTWRPSATVTPAPSTATAVPEETSTATPQYPQYDGPPLRKNDIGVQIHIHREDLRPIIRHLQALDVGWVKVQVSWKLYEPQPDAYAQDRLAELDAVVEAATNNDIRVLLGVSKAPEWSRPITEQDGPPLDYERYRKFTSFLAQRYQGRVSAYELWNEPNLQREWNGASLSAAELVRLVATGAAGIREADPNAVVISAAPAVTGINDGITAIDDRVFLRGMLDAGIGNVVDGIGVHPYGWANPPESTFENPDPAVPTHNDHPSFFFSNTLADYKSLLASYGVEDRLWVTEFGWGSFDQLVDDDGDPAAPPSGAEFMNDVSEWEQAIYLLHALELGQQDGSIGPMIIWNLNFGPLLGHDYSETGYSILRPDGKRRPAYRALEAAPKT